MIPWCGQERPGKVSQSRLEAAVEEKGKELRVRKIEEIQGGGTASLDLVLASLSDV